MTPSGAGRSPLPAVFLVTGLAGLMMGTAIPLVPLALEQRGIDKLTIGLNGATWALGLLLAGPFIPRWAARFGALPTIWAALAVAAAIQLAFAWTDELWLWFLLRLPQGAAVGAPWLITEIWINLAVDEKRRGRALAVYATLIAAGLAIGPLVLQLVGVSGPAPFLACAALAVVVGLPLLAVRGRAPPIVPEEGGNLARTVRLAPLAMLAALVGGIGETVAFTFLPVYAVGAGIAAATATLWQTAFVVGNVVLQMPIGWLADRFDRRLVLLACAATSAAAACALPFAPPDPWMVGPLLVLWGGAAFGIYTVGLAVLGQRFAAGDIARANAAFVMVYTLGSLVGPPVSGGAMELFGPGGLGWSLAAVYAACAACAACAVVAWRRRAA